MYRVIIADDESLFRDYLKNLIDWSSYDFEVAGVAKNGQEAFQLAVDTNPNLALIDINMPVIDGLALAERLKSMNQNIQIVLVTGYDEFEYARSAIRLGIEDYLVKPFDEEELISVLMKIKGRLHRIYDERFSGRNNFPLVRERILNTLLQTDYPLNGKQEIEQLRYLRIPYDDHAFVVTTLEIDHLFNQWIDIEKIIEMKYTVVNILNSILDLAGYHIAFNGPENKILSLTGFKEEVPVDSLLLCQYEKIGNFIVEHFNFSVSAAIGPVVTNFTNIRDSYFKSMALLNQKPMTQGNCVLTTLRMRQDQTPSFYYPQIPYEELNRLLRIKNIEAIEEILNAIFQQCEQHSLSKNSIAAVYLGLKSVCLSFITEMGMEPHQVMGKDYELLSIPENMSSLSATKGRILALYRKTIRNLSSFGTTKSTIWSSKMKTYIDLNYVNSQLNLEMIANHFYMNPDYLRRIFKKELGVTFTDYVVSLRMNQAKKLIDSGHYRVSDIASEVGINNPSYFSKCFKKYFGMSPTDYENTLEQRHI